MKSARKSFLFIAMGLIAAVIAIAMTSHSPQAAEKLDKEEVRKIVKEYLEEHPELVIDAIEAYQANQQEIEQRQFKETITSRKDELYGDDLPFAGNPEGDVTIVEFFDYNCGYCKRALNDLSKILEMDDNVKVVFREMPILSESSRDAARYALAAHKQGKYFEYHQALMKHSGNKNKKTFEKIGKDLDMDIEQLHKDANSKDVREEIEESLALSRDLGIRGTPAFVIGDILAPGYMTYQNMQKIIEQARNGEG